MEICNTLSGKAEPFSPDGKKVKMYVCGITPYDMSHLGHARTVVAFDIIRRYLIFRGYKVTYVQNVTDIEDKIIRRAKEKKMPPLKLAAHYAALSEKEFETLGVMKPDFSPKVSEFIPQIISLIERIEKNGFAYKTGSGVYFDVLKFKKYGALSRQSPETIKSGARVEIDEQKKNPQDFALWKLSEEEGCTYGSPWGRGRPGWHIECSAMSTSLLGDTLDIHGGARDLIFPHHENEIAQSESGTAKPFVKLWMHTGFLTVNGEKMAKSEGNFITIEDGLKKFSPQSLRLLFAMTHYRSPIDFSESAAHSAAFALETLHSAVLAARSYSGKGRGAQLSEAAIEAEEKFLSAMDADFDTPNALSALFSLAKRLLGATSDGAAGEQEARQAGEKLLQLLAVLSLQPAEKKPGINELEIEKLIAKREAARKKKDFAASDAIRGELADKGILLEDRPDGTTAWRRK